MRHTLIGQVTVATLTVTSSSRPEGVWRARRARGASACNMPVEDVAALRDAQARDGVGVVTRIGAMVTVWVAESSVREQVDPVAVQLHEAGARRRAAGAALARQTRWRQPG